ncbi:MAG: ATP-binding protein [Bacteroidota bacterium]
MKVKRVIITGGPSTGKTSIIRDLENQGFQCLHEKSREIIRQSLKDNSDILPWMNLHKFSELVISQRMEQYHKAKSEHYSNYAFYDRGIPDVFAYMNYDNIEVPKQYHSLGTDLRYYDKIFLTPAWKEIYETDNERKEDFYKAERLENYIHNTYKNLGYNVILVPKANIEERIRFILNHLDL